MLVQVDVKKIIATPSAYVIFLGNEDKAFVIHVAPGVGMAMSMTVEGVRRIRPLTHDLISSILAGLGVNIERVVINDLRGGTFYARLFLREESEGGTRIVEIDARPSDCVVLAKQNGAPIYVESSVLTKVGDVSHLLSTRGEASDDSEKE